MKSDCCSWPFSPTGPNTLVRMSATSVLPDLWCRSSCWSSTYKTWRNGTQFEYAEVYLQSTELVHVQVRLLNRSRALIFQDIHRRRATFGRGLDKYTLVTPRGTLCILNCPDWFNINHFLSYWRQCNELWFGITSTCALLCQCFVTPINWYIT